ncbi:gamma-glutamyl-gamma-aminobutyrate hydrolase family protein [Dokdonella koreensis]|uniref:Peptidase C26 n=1 Tax=Dokdonella koreensis DS-123 TaxID=1300342 RepID=A0A160DRN6_9GAMM|nr:type 1 glutamine amidotransferase [Dokdonella koreensis]ANB16845.1 Peptidase C26 [Dokdonella koreensis DS-123]
MTGSETPRKLIIGVSPRILRQVPQELGFRGKTLQYLEQSVAQWVMALGAMVVMVPTVERDSLIRRAHIDIPDIVAALDGLILQGGADIDPAAYGEAPTHTVGAIDMLRDRFELELLRGFAAAGKPVFGICRGMQLINVAFGGTLYQDLRADGATRANHVHADLYDEHVHALRLDPGTWAGRIYGDLHEGRVNSIHHQGVKALGRGVVAGAWSDDGVVEAIRVDGPAFVVGVQWHPEFHDGRNADLLPADPLMQAFLDAAAQARR